MKIWVLKFWVRLFSVKTKLFGYVASACLKKMTYLKVHIYGHFEVLGISIDVKMGVYLQTTQILIFMKMYLNSSSLKS